MVYDKGLCLITDDVIKLAEFYEKVLQTTSERNEIRGARAMHFRDPDGNIVCFRNT